jgi:hypothetical protein
MSSLFQSTQWIRLVMFGLFACVAVVNGSPSNSELRLAQAEVDLETPSASSVETKMMVDRTPPAVQQTIKEHAGNASVNLFKQFENGRFVYEAQFTKEGILNELKIAQDGTLLMRREPRVPTATLPGEVVPEEKNEIPLRNAPALVQETIREQAGTNRVERVRKEMKGDDLVYRANFKHEGVPVAITVAENGTIIGPSPDKQVREAAGAKRRP